MAFILGGIKPHIVVLFLIGYLNELLLIVDEDLMLVERGLYRDLVLGPGLFSSALDSSARPCAAGFPFLLLLGDVLKDYGIAVLRDYLLIAVVLVLGLGDYLVVCLGYTADYIGPLDISLLEGHYHKIPHLRDEIVPPAASSGGVYYPCPEHP